ncbi:MAG: acyl-CoA reductase [Myxococcota bacterium]
MELSSLRGAAGRLRADRTLRALGDWIEAWRGPGSLWRARLCREHPVHSAEGIDRGMTLGLERWTREALARLRAEELCDDARVPQLTAVWLAGSIPTGTFAALLLPLLAGSAIYVKPSSADPVSPRLLADSLRAVDSELARAVAVGDDPRALTDSDAVVVYGRDETVAELRAVVPVSLPFMGYGHKLSAAALGAEAEIDPAVRALALEVALYDGRGCLSPAFGFIEDRPAGRAQQVAECLSSALQQLERELPCGSWTAAEQAKLHELRKALAMRADAQVWASRGTLGWTVVLSRFESSPPIPGSLRVIPLVPVRDLDEVGSWLSGLRPHLACVGQAGWGERRSALGRQVLHAGGSRLCPLGRMQAPPLAWRHDGQPPIRPLLRTLDVEDPEPSA